MKYERILVLTTCSLAVLVTVVACLPADTAQPPEPTRVQLSATISLPESETEQGQAAGANDAEAVEGIDVAGQRVTLLPARQARAIAMIFLLPDCPVANSYAPEIRRIQEDYGERGVVFYLVYVDPQGKPAQVRQHADEFQLPGTLLVDTEHSLVQFAGATRVPEAAVFSPDGQRLYLGRVDNLYAGFGKRRPQATERELRGALDAVLEGRPVSPPGGEVIGCPIPRRRNLSGE